MDNVFATWLKLNPDAQQFFNGLTSTQQQKYEDWIQKAKSPSDQNDRLQHTLYELSNHHERLKIGSYMGDVRPISNINDDRFKRQQLIELSELATPQQMAQFAIAMCQHAAKLMSLPEDPTIHETININQRWLDGEINFQTARKYAGIPMRKAREATTPGMKIFYRFCHQAALTPHVKRHALIASDYLILLTNQQELGTPGNERDWQLNSLNQIVD